jgi:hypothetical protein
MPRGPCCSTSTARPGTTSLLALLDIPDACCPGLSLQPRLRPHAGRPAGGAHPHCRHGRRPAKCAVWADLLQPGLVKNTYGTGCFMLMHTGDHFHPSHHGLITTMAATPDTEPAYAQEGSVFIGGAVVQWLRDGLQGHRRPAARCRQLASSVPDAGGVMFVPAFTGLGAPYWKPGRTRRHRGPDARQHGGPHRAGGAGKHRLPKRGAAAGDGPATRSRWTRPSPNCGWTAAPASTTC